MEGDIMADFTYEQIPLALIITDRADNGKNS